MLEVTVTYMSGESQKLSFAKTSVMIGRASGNDLRVESSGISRYHARLSIDGDSILVQDLESTNGTYVNSRKVDTAPLKPGDKISIGDLVLTAVLIDDEPESPTLGESAPSVVLMPQESEEPVKAESQTQEENGVSAVDGFYWESLRRFLSPVWSYITDDSVSEIMINKPDEIFIERKGKLERAPERFSEDELKAAVLNIAQYVGRRVDEQEPYLDARLPDGSRVAVLLPPCSRRGVAVAIRKFSKEKLTLDKLVEFGSLNRQMLIFLQACVVLRKNIIVSGGTSSGKTSLLNVLSCLIPNDERILTIEDSAELQLGQEHILPMETRPPDKKGKGQVTIRDLVKVSLRMRPDRIIVGEIRGGEALDLLQAMNTGHSGSMATVHASSPRQALSRMETLALFSGFEIPMSALREQVSSAVDFVVQAARLPDHSRKVTHISEVGGLEKDGSYVINDIFRFNRTDAVGGKIKGEHLYTGHAPQMLDELEMAGLTDAVALFKQ